MDLLTERTVAAQRRTLGRDAGTAAGCPGIMSFNSRPCPARSVRPVRRPAPPGSRMPPRVTPRFIEPGGYRAGSGPGRARARLRLFFPVTPPPPPPTPPAPRPLTGCSRVRPPALVCQIVQIEIHRIRYHWPSSKVAWKSRPSSLGRFFTDFIAAPGMKIADQESGFKVK